MCSDRNQLGEERERYRCQRDASFGKNATAEGQVRRLTEDVRALRALEADRGAVSDRSSYGEGWRVGPRSYGFEVSHCDG